MNYARIPILAVLLAAALAAADSGVAPAINAFSADLYRQVAAGDANLILSPFNVDTALSMVLAGARGRTAGEMQSVLHVGADARYDADLAALVAGLAKAGNGDGNQLLTANGLWVQRGFRIEPAFQDTLARHYHAPPALVDFMGHAETVREQINGWTEEHTKQRIKDLLPPGSVDTRTRLVLTSAIYFYGKWQDPFLTSRTQPAPFNLAAGGSTQANFMHQTAHFGYAQLPSARILEMPYAGTGMAFDVLLPDAVGGLPELEKSLTQENLAGWLGKLTLHKVEVSLPKFRAESRFSLAKTLSAMGMPGAFSRTADFTGIAPQGGLQISEVAHKAFVDVSEEGTEAAAATGIPMRTTAVRAPEQTVIFNADHPFLFLIRDTGSQAILFIGRVTNPR